MTGLKGTRILITGAGGFIGRKLASQLLLMGAEVYGTSRSDRSRDELPIAWRQTSFEDFDSVKRIISSIQPSIIFHLSGLVTGANGKENILPAYHSLVTSTVNVLSVAADIGCDRIIIPGSSNEPIGHDPNSPYSAAKWASSMYGRLYHKLYNLPVVVARTFVGYGPGQPSDKLIPYVISQLSKGVGPKLSSGLWKTDWIYIDDIIDGMIQCAVVPGIEGSTIDIGTGQLASVRQIVEQIVTLMEPSVLPQFGALPDRHAEHTPVADTQYTWEKLRWRAAVSLEEGLRRTVLGTSVLL